MDNHLTTEDLSKDVKPLDSEEFVKVYAKALELRKANPEFRIGQSWMVALHEISPLSYTKITGTDDDPFYDDNKLSDFISALI